MGIKKNIDKKRKRKFFYNPSFINQNKKLHK